MTAVPGMYGDIKLIAGTSCSDLSMEIANHLSALCGKPIGLANREIYKFPNDNTFVRLGESVRGQDVYIIQTCIVP